MMREFMLEVCTDSVESAAAAVRGGARRLEVCANLVIGGTTPGVSQFKQMRKACDIPLNVLLRPRYGDFLYTEAEFTMLLEDTAMFRKLGASHVFHLILQEIPYSRIPLPRPRRHQRSFRSEMRLQRNVRLCCWKVFLESR